jgi:hypothetical protein
MLILSIIIIFIISFAALDSSNIFIYIFVIYLITLSVAETSVKW